MATILWGLYHCTLCYGISFFRRFLRSSLLDLIIHLHSSRVGLHGLSERTMLRMNTLRCTHNSTSSAPEMIGFVFYFIHPICAVLFLHLGFNRAIDMLVGLTMMCAVLVTFTLLIIAVDVCGTNDNLYNPPLGQKMGSLLIQLAVMGLTTIFADHMGIPRCNDSTLRMVFTLYVAFNEFLHPPGRIQRKQLTTSLTFGMAMSVGIRMLGV